MLQAETASLVETVSTRLRSDDLPWKLPGDLKFFKEMTTGTVTEGGDLESQKNVVIMGRKTWESILPLSKGSKPPLPNRYTYVISSQKESAIGADSFPGAVGTFPSLQEALENADEDARVRDVFVVGGQGIFTESQKYAQKACKNIFHTRIGQDVEGDVKLDLKSLHEGFHLQEISKTDSANGLNYDYTRWVNKSLFPECFEEFNHRVFKSQNEEQQYLDLIEKIIREGVRKDDRTGVGTLSTFGNMMRYDLSKSFPLLTTKRVAWKAVVEELLWFLRGHTDGKILSDKGVKIWDGNGSREFLDKMGFKDRREGDLGPVYGFQWRHFGAQYKTCDSDYAGQGVDQISEVISQIQSNPDSRRLLVNAWNVKDLPSMALPPCHVLFQFYTSGNSLSCLLYQRSCDIGLGIPFNIASYALLTHMIAKVYFFDLDYWSNSRRICSCYGRYSYLY